jgi:hypothetical protein
MIACCAASGIAVRSRSSSRIFRGETLDALSRERSVAFGKLVELRDEAIARVLAEEGCGEVALSLP